MELRVLEYYLVVVREENISRAAEILHITQPSLSRQMAQLEEELGKKLFIRGRHLQLTDAGILLRKRAEEIVSLVDKTTSEFKDTEDITGVVSIGAGGFGTTSLLSKAAAEFHDLYPGVSFQIYTNSTGYISERLEQGLLDFGILLEPVDITKFEYLRLSDKEQWGLLVSTENPLSKKEVIQPDDLKDQILAIPARTGLQKELENWCGTSLKDLDILTTFNLITNAVPLVDTNIACAITIAGAAQYYDRKRMKFIPVEPQLSMSSVLVWKKYLPAMSTAGRFLEYLKERLH